MKKTLLTALLFIATNPSLFACAVCFGNKDSLQVKGAMMGVYALLGVIVVVLSCIGAFIISSMKRAKKLPDANFSSAS